MLSKNTKTKQIEITGCEHKNNRKNQLLQCLFELQYTLKVERGISDWIIWIPLHIQLKFIVLYNKILYKMSIHKVEHVFNEVMKPKCPLLIS